MLNKTKIVALSLLALFIVFVIGFVGVFFVSFGFSDSALISESHAYELSTYNPKTNSTRKHIVQLGRVLKEDEHISYRGGDGMFITISHFSKIQYECIGSCFCEEERRVAGVIGRGLFFIVGAVSSTLAVSIASKYYQEQCVAQFARFCGSAGVRNRIERCDERVKEEPKVNENQNRRKKFHCEGRCTINEELMHPHAIKRSKQGRCDEHSIEGDTIVDTWHSYHQSEARVLFREQKLEPFCKEISTYHIPVEFPEEPEIEVNLCAAVIPNWIHCAEIE